ncbi:MAG: YcgN family cysteine cluster protein [Treponema sp.]|nr:YcgN family cysteine cluster protein [Treponema sp.]
MEQNFWQSKKLEDFSDEEWESVCDGCGKCCYRKYITGNGKKERLYYTKVACNFLNLKTNRCTVYDTRLTDCPECEKLSKENLASCDWLPDTCAYRLLQEGKGLEGWHPLVSGNKGSVKRSGICIEGGIHEKDCDDWQNYVLYVEKYKK